MQIETFKVSPHSCAQIMGGTIGLTDKQESRLEELRSRNNGEGKPLTEKMKVELDDLIEKKENPSLPQGLKTYVEDWYKNQLYKKRRPQFITKEIHKGLAKEDEAIEYAADVLGLGMVFKNEERFENEYCIGTPDIIPRPIVADIKCSFDHITFPLLHTVLPNSDYFYQLQCYMWLTGLEDSMLIYVLMDAPEEIVNSYAWNLLKESDETELTEEVWESAQNALNYSHYPDRLRLKTFKIKRCEKTINEIKNRVELCRGYLETIKIAA